MAGGAGHLFLGSIVAGHLCWVSFWELEERRDLLVPLLCCAVLGFDIKSSDLAAWVWLKDLSFGSVPLCVRFAILWFVRCTYPGASWLVLEEGAEAGFGSAIRFGYLLWEGSNRMGRWRRRVLCPWLLCALVVLLSIHGSKGNRIRLGIRF